MSVSLSDAIFWVAVVCSAIAQLAILRSVVVSPTSVPSADPETRGRRVAEIAWAVLPGFVLAALFVYTWRAMHAAPITAATASSVIS